MERDRWIAAISAMQDPEVVNSQIEQAKRQSRQEIFFAVIYLLVFSILMATNDEELEATKVMQPEQLLWMQINTG